MIPKKALKIASKIIPNKSFANKMKYAYIKDGKFVCSDSFLLFEFEPKEWGLNIPACISKKHIECLEKLAHDIFWIKVICKQQLSQSMIEIETYANGRILIPDTDEQFVEYKQNSIFGNWYMATQKILPNKSFDLFIECCKIVDPTTVAQSTDITWEYTNEDLDWKYTIIIRKYQDQDKE